MNTDLILQALIIAGITAVVTAAATGYVNGVVTSTKLNGMKETLQRLDEELKSIRERLHQWAPHIGWVEQQRRFGKDER